MSQDGRFATDLSVQVVSVETVVQEVVVKTVVQEVVVETVVRCIELRADESGPRAWVQPAARGREGRSVRQRAGAAREHVRSAREESERTGVTGSKTREAGAPNYRQRFLFTLVTHLPATSHVTHTSTGWRYGETRQQPWATTTHQPRACSQIRQTDLSATSFRGGCRPRATCRARTWCPHAWRTCARPRRPRTRTGRAR